jgi:hypothetical protein
MIPKFKDEASPTTSQRMGRKQDEKPTRDPRFYGHGAVGQCLYGSCAEAPITGAGLDPSSTPAGIRPNGSEDEGCGGTMTCRAI